MSSSITIQLPAARGFLLLCLLCEEDVIGMFDTFSAARSAARKLPVGAKFIIEHCGFNGTASDEVALGLRLANAMAAAVFGPRGEGRG